MSVDQCAEVPAPVVNSLYDILYETHFRNIIPAILKMLYLFTILKDSPKNTDASRLFKRLHENQHLSVIELNATSMSTVIENGSPLMQTVSDVMNGNRALILIRYFCDRFQVIAKELLGEKATRARRLQISKESFFAGITTALIRKHLNWDMRKLIEYR